MKKGIKVLLGVVVVFAVLIMVIAFFAQNVMKNKAEEMDSVPVVELEDVADGVYEGIAETPLVKVTVEVTVENHEIADIKLIRHENGKGAPAESMIPEMLKQNTSEVDGVSGATLSSKTIKAAVRNALAKEKSE